jgi:hypothetical protein
MRVAESVHFPGGVISWVSRWMRARHDHMAIVARPTRLDVHGQKRDHLGWEPVWVFPS